MATKKRPTRGPQLSGEAKAAYKDIQKGLKNLERSIEDVRKGLMRAEKQIETEARQRIKMLRQEGNAQLKALQGRRREATVTMKRLSGAAGESWREIKSAADSLLSDAGTVATSVIDRFRSAIRR